MSSIVRDRVSVGVLANHWYHAFQLQVQTYVTDPLPTRRDQSAL
jgi:hypothetical protein